MVDNVVTSKEVYEVKTSDEIQWGTIQVGIVTVIGWALVTYVAMPDATAIAAAGVVSAVARPVLGYLLSWLPQKERN